MSENKNSSKNRSASRSVSRSTSRSPVRSVKRSTSRSHSRSPDLKHRRSSSRNRSHSRSPSRGRYRSRSRSKGRSYISDDEEGKRLHIGDLGTSVSKSELQSLFEKYGPLKEVWVARGPPSFAFVIFNDKYDAADALRETDNTYLGGRRIRVSMARPRTRGTGFRSYHPEMRCYKCGRKGHFARECSYDSYGYGSQHSRSRSPRRRESSRYSYYGNPY